MIRRFLLAGLLISAFGVMPARDASAGIVSVTASGPGGTVSGLTINTLSAPNNNVDFSANYTADARIVFTVTVDGPGTYFLGAFGGLLTNSTGATFPNFYANILSAPTATTFTEGGGIGSVFSGISFNSPYPNATGLTYSGPPGLGAGDQTFINLGFQVLATGGSTIEISLSPQSSAVPEPSSLALCGIAGLTGLAVARARRKRN